VLRGTLCLRPADRVQRHIALTLEPVLRVIRRLAVAPQYEPKQLQPAREVRPAAGRARSLRAAILLDNRHNRTRIGRLTRVISGGRLPGAQFLSLTERPAVTASGSSICGQSFHNRSSA